MIAGVAAAKLLMNTSAGLRGSMLRMSDTDRLRLLELKPSYFLFIKKLCPKAVLLDFQGGTVKEVPMIYPVSNSKMVVKKMGKEVHLCDSEKGWLDTRIYASGYTL